MGVQAMSSFDPGRIASRVRDGLRANAGWQPDLHPRDRKGRFREKVLDQFFTGSEILAEPPNSFTDLGVGDEFVKTSGERHRITDIGKDGPHGRMDTEVINRDGERQKTDMMMMAESHTPDDFIAAEVLESPPSDDREYMTVDEAVEANRPDESDFEVPDDDVAAIAEYDPELNAMEMTRFDTDLSDTDENGILTSESQEQLRQELVDEFSEDAVDDVYEMMADWKASRADQNAIDLAWAYARHGGLDENVAYRTSSDDPDSVDEERLAVVGSLHWASVGWYNQNKRDAMWKRGIKNAGGSFAISTILADDQIVLEDGSMDNWSWNDDIPDEWSRKGREPGAKIRTDHEPSKFIMTIDGIAADYTRYHDDAATFTGETQVNAEDISVSLWKGADNYDFYPGIPVSENDSAAARAFLSELNGFIRMDVDSLTAGEHEKLVDYVSQFEEEFGPDVDGLEDAYRALRGVDIE